MRVCTERYLVTTGGSIEVEVTEHVEVLSTCAPGGACEGRRDRAPTAGERVAGSRECSDRRVCVTLPFPPLADRRRGPAPADAPEPTPAAEADPAEADPAEPDPAEPEDEHAPSADPPAASGCGCRAAPARARPVGSSRSCTGSCSRGGADDARARAPRALALSVHRARAADAGAVGGARAAAALRCRGAGLRRRRRVRALVAGPGGPLRRKRVDGDRARARPAELGDRHLGRRHGRGPLHDHGARHPAVQRRRVVERRRAARLDGAATDRVVRRRARVHRGARAGDRVGWRRIRGVRRRHLARPHAIWGQAEDDLWVGGGHGAVVHFDGQRMEARSIETDGAVVQLWGASESDLWAVAENPWGVFHWDGRRWRDRTGRLREQRIRAVGGTPDQVYAAGDFGVARWTGARWQDVLRVSEDVYDAPHFSDVCATRTHIIIAEGGVQTWAIPIVSGSRSR